MKHIISTIFLVGLSTYLLAQQINKCEYFFDTDPGIGNGISIAVSSPDDSVILSSAIPVNSIPVGFHKLGMRFFSSSTGKWSHNEARTFYIAPTPNSPSTLISKAEYFFDTDPGKGNGTALAITSGDSAVFNSIISSAALSVGFHKLVIRFCDDKNVWSHNEARSFYIMNIPTFPTTQLKRAEYFFDTDPGQGNATQAALTTITADSATLITALPATSLSFGFHQLGIRFYDNTGRWSHNEVRSFFIAATQLSPSTQVVAAEYFFNGIDPGVGKATAIVGFTPGDSATINKIIAASGLAGGQTHKLTIRVKDDKNVWSLNETRTFDVCNSPAIANFTVTRSGNTVTLTNSSTNSYGYLWKFGDDSTSTLKDPVHTYAYGGKFNIYLIAINPCGNDTIFKSIDFNCSPPSAYFYSTINQLEVSTTNASYGATSYSWNFGDGFTSTATSPKHTYYSAGTYSVCATANNGCGSSSYCTNVNVTCSTPMADFSSSTNGLTAYFNNKSTNAANITWHFGDGGISNLLSPSYTYNSSGTYTVKLIVSNACGIDSIERSLTFVCALPIPAFDFNADGLTVEFENNSTSATSYKWNFGDNTTSTFKNPSHKYATTGTYNVCMITSNGCGKDSVCTMISACTPPTADFIYSDSALTMSFVNASLNGETYYWTFGTTDASNLKDPVYKYASPGTYNVCLNVTNACGTDKKCKSVSTSCTPFGAPQICMVTVDSLSQYNVIYWDKTPFSGGAVDSFIVYREVSANVYKPIGKRAFADTSMLVDTARTMYPFPLANGNPNTGTYRYKIQFKDSCGGHSRLSFYHNTIYITYLGNGQFTWNPRYTIGSLADTVKNYILLRDDLRTGKWKPVASVAGTQNTLVDGNHKLFAGAEWRVVTDWDILCTAKSGLLSPKKGYNDVVVFTETTVTKSRSNIMNNLPVVGIQKNDADKELVQIYPNPATNNLTIEWSEQVAYNRLTITVQNYLGMSILKFMPDKNQTKMTFNISNLATGLYFIDLSTEDFHSVKKVVVE